MEVKHIRQTREGQAIKLPVFFFIAVSMLLLGISGCVTMNDPEASQEYHAHIVGEANKNNPVGQTLISRRPRLETVLFWINLDPSTAPQDGILTVDVFHSPDDIEPVKSIPIPFNEIAGKDSITIPLQIRGDLPNQEYYLRLSTNSGSISVYGRNEDVYPNGQLFIDGVPQEADIGFRLAYDYNPDALFEDIRDLLLNIGLLIPVFLTLWLPGQITLNLLNLDNGIDRGAKFALAIGVSLAIIPLALFWTSTGNFQLNSTSVRIILILLVVLYLWQIRAGLLNFLKRPKLQPGKYWKIELALIGIFLITLLVRIAMVRDMAAPAWVDSVHHALITRLIVELGQFPESYLPFLKIGTAHYHPGFHSVVAVIQWLTNWDLQESILLVGQLLNALSVFAVYLFTVTLTKNRIAGIFAALTTGLLTPMPAYYTSWGRYPQLVGLLILPAALTFILILFNRLSRSKISLTSLVRRKNIIKLILVTAITIAGLFLTHYRVTAFLFCLLFAYLTVILAKSLLKKSDIRNQIQAIILLFIVILIAVLLTALWWPDTITTLFIPKLPGGDTPIAWFSDFSWGYLTSALGTLTLVIAGLGILLGFFKNRTFVMTLLLWVLILFLLANLGTIPLPGAQFINNTSVTIMLFIPISALAGYFIAWIVMKPNEYLRKPLRYAYHLILGMSALAISLYGAMSIMPILNPITMLTRGADIPAMDWINENIPPDEVILINPFGWGYGLYAGNDGGYWISPLAGRITMPPPVLYGMVYDSEEAKRINEVSQQVIALSDDIAALHTFLVEQDIEYIYVGSRGGALSPNSMNESPLFGLLYQGEGTWAFRVISTIN